METIEQNSAEKPSLYLDWNIEDPKARTEKVKEIIDNTPSERLTPTYLEKMADYIIKAADKKDRKEKKEKNFLTDNIMVTLNKRELSFEGLIDKFENGEDGIYNIMTNDKNILFAPKKKITPQDLETVPGLKELVEEIKKVEAEYKAAYGKKKSHLLRQLIEMRQDQYVLKNATKKISKKSSSQIGNISKIDLTERIYLNTKGEIVSTGLINLFEPKHISALLCNYSKIKEDCWGKLDGDINWLMIDLENLIDNNIKEQYPLYFDIIVYKIDGKSNAEIQEKIYEDYHIRHSVEYISSLWRNKIPDLIAEAASRDWLVWHYTEEVPGHWKKCNRCGQIKLGHPMFFSKNKSSKDGLYSICKACRNKKG